MKYAQILATLSNEPLALPPANIASLVQLFADHRNSERAVREGVGVCGEAVECEQAELIDGIMHIPVSGPIGRGLGKFEKGAGAVDVADIQDEIDNAEEDPLCRGIILLMDSPGGMYSGIPELSDRIMQCNKMTAAFIPGMACSAAYWLAASCDVICATKSADIANVGVYCYILDQSKRFEAMGIKPELITSGEYKGMGAPGIALTKPQRAHLQARVDQMSQEFYRHVQTRRSEVALENLQGQCFKAPEALALGFIDMIVRDLESVVALF